MKTKAITCHIVIRQKHYVEEVKQVKETENGRD